MSAAAEVAPAVLNAGRYAAYVWPAYGISGAVLAGLAVAVVLRARRWRRRAQAAEGARVGRAMEERAG